MAYFDESHPLHEFNKDFYIESGKVDEHIYIFKFNGKGAQVVLDLSNRKEPLAFIYPLIFISDLTWDVDLTSRAMVIEGRTQDDILERLKNELRLMKNGKITSEDS